MIPKLSEALPHLNQKRNHEQDWRFHVLPGSDELGHGPISLCDEVPQRFQRDTSFQLPRKPASGSWSAAYRAPDQTARFSGATSVFGFPFKIERKTDRPESKCCFTLSPLGTGRRSWLRWHGGSQLKASDDALDIGGSNDSPASWPMVIPSAFAGRVARSFARTTEIWSLHGRDFVDSVCTKQSAAVDSSWRFSTESGDSGYDSYRSWLRLRTSRRGNGLARSSEVM